MTLKIERISGMYATRIRLSGQLRSENVGQVKSEMKGAVLPVALDLKEVDLIDIDGIRFLNDCEAEAIQVLQCSSYVREWMLRERSRPEARAQKRKKGRNASHDEHGGAPIEG